MTYRYVAYQVQTALKQIGDDKKLSLSEIVYYIQVVTNRLKYQHLRNQDARNDMTGAYLSIFDGVSVTHMRGYSYFTLPEEIYDLDFEKGIAFISYPYRYKGEWLCTNFNQTKASKVFRLKLDAYEAPSSSNPYFYRVGRTTVHLIGCDNIKENTIVVGLYTALSTGTVSSLDAVVPINEEHIESLVFGVLNLARFSTVVTPERLNDGTDTIEKINSVQNLLGFKLSNEEQQQQQQ